MSDRGLLVGLGLKVVKLELPLFPETLQMVVDRNVVSASRGLHPDTVQLLEIDELASTVADCVVLMQHAEDFITTNVLPLRNGPGVGRLQLEREVASDLYFVCAI